MRSRVVASVRRSVRLEGLWLTDYSGGDQGCAGDVPGGASGSE